MKTSILLAGLALTALAPAAWAPAAWAAGAISPHIQTAGDLADLCAANPKDAGADARINFCHGFAQGAVDADRKFAGDKKHFCLPNPAPRREATLQEFANWVHAIPAHRALGPLDGLFQFLGERFPCK